MTMTEVDEERRKRIRQLLPEIDLVHDKKLQEKIVEAWLAAWCRGNYRNLEKAPFGTSTPNFNLIEHVRATTKIAVQMATVIQSTYNVRTNLDTLVTACLLHDIDKVAMYKEDRKGIHVKTEAGEMFPHGFLGAHIAWNIGLSDDVVHMIATHSPSSPLLPNTTEGVIAVYADLAAADCIILLSKSKLLLGRLKST